MAMNGPALAAVLKSAIAALPEDQRDFDSVWNAVGDALIAYIQTNAVVTGTATVLGTTGPVVGVVT